MFRQIKYLLVETSPSVKISKIVGINCTPVGIESVVTADGRLVIIDWIDNILVEFTGKFDHDGQEINTGDLVEITRNEKDGPVVDLYLIGWAQGAFVASHIEDENKGFILSDEASVMQTRKVGNQFENQDIVTAYLKKHADEKMSGSDGEIGANPKEDDQVAKSQTE